MMMFPKVFQIVFPDVFFVEQVDRFEMVQEMQEMQEKAAKEVRLTKWLVKMVNFGNNLDLGGSCLFDMFACLSLSRSSHVMIRNALCISNFRKFAASGGNISRNVILIGAKSKCNEEKA